MDAGEGYERERSMTPPRPRSNERERSMTPPRPKANPRPGSQFEGAAALFQQKESELLLNGQNKNKKGQDYQEGQKPSKRSSQFGNAMAMLGFQEKAGASLSQLDTMGMFDSPPPFVPKRTVVRESLNINTNSSVYTSNHTVPSFVSPGAGRASWVNTNHKHSTTTMNDIAAPPLQNPSSTTTPLSAGNRFSATRPNLGKQASVSVLSLDSRSEHAPRMSWIGRSKSPTSNASANNNNGSAMTSPIAASSSSKLSYVEARQRASMANTNVAPRKYSSALNPTNGSAKDRGAVDKEIKEEGDMPSTPRANKPQQSQRSNHHHHHRASLAVASSTFSPSPTVWKQGRASVAFGTSQGGRSDMLMAAPFGGGGGGGSSSGSGSSSIGGGDNNNNRSSSSHHASGSGSGKSHSAHTRSSFAFIPNPSMLRKSIILDSSPSVFSSNHAADLEKFDDIKIEAHIPDIDAILRTRKQKTKRHSATAGSHNNNNNSYHNADLDVDDNVPEHIRKYREKERARQAALDEKERLAEVRIHAVVSGWWFRRKHWPRLQQEHAKRRQIQAEFHAKEQFRNHKATQIQSAFRGLGPRKIFQRQLAKIRLQKQQQQRIKEIEGKIQKLQRQTVTDIEAMRKKCHEQKRAMDHNVKLQVKQEEDRLAEIRSTGKSLIEYLKKENQKVREAIVGVEKDIVLARKQDDVLQQRKRQVADQIAALDEFIAKINAKIKKNESMDSKCRTRYLPRHREDLEDRDNHCILESRVRNMYRDCIDTILFSLGDRNKDRTLNESVIRVVTELEQEIKTLPRIPTPESLKPRILGINVSVSISEEEEEERGEDYASKNVHVGTTHTKPETIVEEDEP
jgi:hypothetical protein